MSSTPEFPRHVVTAVLVTHDGARWLPDALAGLLAQERPVQNVMAADTGSADDSAQLVADAVGADRVLHLARRTGFGAAVEEAARTAPVLGPEDLPYLKRPSGWDPVSRSWNDEAYDLPELPHGEPVQWLWLLHDDCAPEPGALAELLRVADSDSDAAVIGPKLRGWYDRKQLLETGVSIARSGRRWTGLDRREQDQGQHDQIRSVLSVSTAGMLIRRDVFEELGGFDRRLPLMRDDVDLCWRAHSAGHRVLIAPDAVLRHAEASARERRTVDCAGRTAANPHRVDKAGAVYTLLANSRGAALPYVFLRLVVSTLLRTLAYLVGKVPGQAVDEVMGLLATLLRPEKILAARKRRKNPAVPASELRPLFPPPGATVRAAAEQFTANFGGSEADSGGSRHGVVESGPGGDDADYLEIEQFARLKKIARKPGPVLFGLLLLISLVACRNLFAGGSLAGGALLPAPDTVSGLWSRYADGWHALGTGGTQSAPPYLAVLAALSALFLGSTSTALTLLLVCSVPLAGFTAYFAARGIVESRLLRAWAAIAYAFLPAATGALAAGRLGTAVLAILLPLIARAAVAAHGFNRPDRGSWRATWAYTFLLTFAMAFTPIVWPLAVLLGLGVLAVRRTDLTAYGLRFLAAVGTPLLVLAPWSLSLLTGPSAFLREAGLDVRTGTASALDLLGTSPGGPGTTGGLLLIGLVLAALAGLLREDRQVAVRAAWAAALAGLLFAAVSNGAGGTGWAGPATLVYGAALLAAGMIGAEGGRTRVAAHGFGWRQPVAALIALACALGPAVAAAGWMIGGADGPLTRRDPVQVPAFVAEESGTRDQPRTLVLGGTTPGEVSYTLVRGSGARLGDGELTAAADADPRLDVVVAHLVAGSGADQTEELSGYAIRYVLVRDGAPRQVSRVLDSTPGLSRLSQLDGSALWRVDREIARIMIVPPAATTEDAKPADAKPGAGAQSETAKPVAVAAGPVEAHTEVPAGPEGRVLRLADRAADGWTATLDGKELNRTTVDGWAQGFQLPAQGGRLDLTYDEPLTHAAWIWAQVGLAVVLLVLALPGRRREIDDDLPEEELAIPAQAIDGDGRRARRLRAAAEAEAETAATPETESAAIPEQQTHEPREWDTGHDPAYAQTQSQSQPQAQDQTQPQAQPYADQGYYQEYAADPYQQQPYAYPQQGYEQQPYADQGYAEQPYAGQGYEQPQQQYDQQQAYDPQQYDQQAYDPYGYGYGHPQGHETEQRPDGSSNQ
ncbi:MULTISPECIES: glycosyltransferase family 2 protein [Streptomyces]|uniref:Family 2 glycosyl transferase n=1 Tax=Streptomyces viridochromogenes TaxID=1938 RepID=A0A0L8LCS7_STRVR|nr:MULTISPECIES: glycosyltransferase family 2 protein [Streptomyces]KOG35955.1 family 2 glycosyl transferase [Streptomyces viridochromogenes]